MIRLTGEIIYADDRREPVEVLQGEFAEWELFALRSGIPLGAEGPATPVLMLQFLGYAAAHRGVARGERPDFEDWRAGVKSVDIEGDLDASEAATTVFPKVQSAG